MMFLYLNAWECQGLDALTSKGHLEVVDGSVLLPLIILPLSWQQACTLKLHHRLLGMLNPKLVEINVVE